MANEFGRSALYFKLGYFSLIGLLRTHVLLGDYHQALKTVEHLELEPKVGQFWREMDPPFHIASWLSGVGEGGQLMIDSLYWSPGNVQR